jgi:hypothetical protein
MMLLAWHRGSRGPYPVLHYVAIAAKGEGEPDTRNRIVQSNVLTEDQEKALDAMPDGVSRVDAAAKFYPYIPPYGVDEALDSPPTIGEVYGAIDGAVSDYRRRMRRFDGQTAQIDKENGNAA